MTRRSFRGEGAGTIATALIVLTVVAYLPALSGGFFWDDIAYVTQNPTLRSATGLWRIWSDPASTPQYYPLVFTTFWVEHQLWGTSAGGYHAVNVLLHGINAALLWIVLRRLEAPGAFLAAAIFAVHPVHVDSVAWISERKNVLCGAFALLALLAWWRFARTRRLPHYAVGMLLFTCALLSKTAACGLPLVIVLLAWWRAPQTWRSQILPAAGALLVAAGLASVTVWREDLRELLDPAFPALSSVERLLVSARAAWFYTGKLLWPVDLMTVYPRWQVDGNVLWQYVFPLGASAVVVALWALRRRVGRGPLVAVLSFVILSAPTLGFVPFGFQRFSFVADHFQYLASMALIPLFTAMAFVPNVPWQQFRVLLTVAIVLPLTVLTWQRAQVYANAATLWRHEIAENPESWIAHTNFGEILQQQRRFDEAIPHFEAAVRIRPDYSVSRNFLGLELLRRGDAAAAAEHLATAVRIRPTFASAYNNWGLALKSLGDTAEAIDKYKTAAGLEPGSFSARNNWGAALASQGKLAEAIELYRSALSLDPNYLEAHYNLGLACLELKRFEEAAAHFAAAVRLDPDLGEARFNLGEALLEQGRVEEAVPQLAAAARLKPRYAPAHRLLGTALERQGRWSEATEAYAKAVQLDWRDEVAQAGLQRMRGGSGH